MKINNWQTKRLGEICMVIAGQSPESKFYNKVGMGLPFYQGKKEFGDKFIGPPKVWTTEVTKEALPDDILMSVRAPVGPTNFATEKICIGRGLTAIRAGRELNKDFLFNFLRNFESEIVGNTGAVFNSINKTQIENIEVSFPSLDEQKALVKKFEVLSAEIKRIEKVYEQKFADLEELKKSVLKKIFTREL